MDAGYIGPPLPTPHKPGERYTGGYTHDPYTGGGFEPNWTRSEGSKFALLKRLPKNFAITQARLGLVDLNPPVSDRGRWWMARQDTIPYTKSMDRYAVGTWRNGWWRLEVTRQRHTGSPFDVPIDSGIYLWVAVFDHTQTRHSRHLHPVRLVLQ